MLDQRERLILRQVAFKGAVELLKELNSKDNIVTVEMVETLTDGLDRVLQKGFVEESTLPPKQPSEVIKPAEALF